MSRKAFTLAEILITLTVIGVIAALTIPTLLQNTNQAEFKVALKRDFADLQQATLSIKNDAGGSLVNAFRNGTGDAKDSENLKNAYREKLSYIKDCSGTADNGGITNGGASTLGCWHTSNNWKYLNGSTIPGSNTPGLILSNGTLAYFGMYKSDCSRPDGDYTVCGYIDFDVNGFKKPNTVGKDIFELALTDSGLIPTGARGSIDPSTDCTPTGNGFSCTAKYLYE